LAVFDLLRGVAVIFMVLYHLFFLLADEFVLPFGVWGMQVLEPLQPFIAGTFIFICGIASRFSKSNTRRGLILLGCAILISIITYLLTYIGVDLFIRFGVMHFLAICVLLFAIKQVVFPGKQERVLVAFVMSVFFLIAFVWVRTKNPLAVFEETTFLPLFILGLPSTLSSADYFPIIPWGFLFVSGLFFGVVAKSKAIAKSCSKSICQPVEWLGRHALPIYMLHQAVIYSLLRLFF
jgi:uncharacterized membrane protein